MFDQGVQLAPVLPGALFTIWQVEAEAKEALVTVVGFRSCLTPPGAPPSSPAPIGAKTTLG